MFLQYTQNTNITPPVSEPPIQNHTSRKFWLSLFVVLILVLVSIGLFYLIKMKDKATVIEESFSDKCSTYLNICISDKENKWKTDKDELRDFDLTNQSENISIAFVYSDTLEFKEFGPSFTDVFLINSNKPAYKSVSNGLTQIMSGTKLGGKTLIVILASQNDITADKTKEVFSLIKTRIR